MVKSRKTIKTYLIKQGMRDALIALQDPRIIRVYMIGSRFYADVCQTCCVCKVETGCP